MADTVNRVADTLISGTNNAESIENHASNVTIRALGGDDTIDVDYGHMNVIQYASDEGNDVIVGIDANDTIQLLSGSIDGVTGSGDDITIQVGSGSITVKDAKNIPISIKDSTGKLRFLLYDGSNIIEPTLINKDMDLLVPGTNGNDVIYNLQGYKTTISSGEGNDTIFSVGYWYDYESDDCEVIQYTGGNDVIYRVYNAATFQGLLDIGSNKVTSTLKSGNDLVLNTNTGSVTLKDHFYYSERSFMLRSKDSKGNDVYTYYLDDGNVYNYIYNHSAAEVTGSAGNDYIYNEYNTSDATIISSKGNDYIYDRGRNTLFKYASGDGDDTIYAYDNNSTIQVTSGSISDVSLAGNRWNPSPVVKVGTGSLTLLNSGSSFTVVDKGSGTIKMYDSSSSSNKEKSYKGSDNEDFIYFGSLNNSPTIEAGAGDDTIYNSMMMFQI